VAGATFPPRAVQVVKAAGAGCGWARRCPLRGCGRAESAWGLRALRSCAPRRPSGPGKVGLGEGQLWIPPSTAAPPGARSLRPSRRQPTACPRAGKKPHPPARNAGLPGRRRAAGGGRRGAAGKVGESAARPALPGLPGPRRPGHLATSPTFPAGHTDRGTSGSQGLRASRGWKRGGSPDQAAPVPSASPQALAPRLTGGAGCPVSPHPSPPSALGPGWGEGTDYPRSRGVASGAPGNESHTLLAQSQGPARS
jgi:hypothetical protein